jgi:hypothetical protein
LVAGTRSLAVAVPGHAEVLPVAAFPPPTLDLHVPLPLRQLFRCCETECVTGCCGVDAFVLRTAEITVWLCDHHPHAAGVFEEFETLLNTVWRHRGSVTADERNGLFNAVWQTPHDTLSYFAQWRWVIAEAVASFPNVPFFSPTWLTEPVVALREGILADRAFDRLPILADALEEAGCDNWSVLDHLREGDDHSHMCWVLDVLSVGGGRPVT